MNDEETKKVIQGRWDLTLQAAEGPLPAWLEIRHSGQRTLVGQFVSTHGSARPVARVEVSECKQIDLLPPDEQGHSRLAMRLSSREGATGRVEEVMLALGYDPYDVRVDRVKLNLNEPVTASPA